MDLKELRPHSSRRHPWEVSRVRAVRAILGDILARELRVLDLGCGDGYVCSYLIGKNNLARITACDKNLTRMQAESLNMAGGDRIRFLSELPGGDGLRYDLVLLLDVIEHISDAHGFLGRVTEELLAENGIALITAPAFQCLYGPHDEFLGHYRRYDRRELEGLARGAGLEPRSSGYLFTIPLVARIFLNALHSVLGRDCLSPPGPGVGEWRGGGAVTWLVSSALDLNNAALLRLSRLGINLPGLTSWVLCRSSMSRAREDSTFAILKGMRNETSHSLKPQGSVTRCNYDPGTL